MTAPFILMGELMHADRALDAAIAAADDSLAASLARVARGGDVGEEDFHAAFGWALRGREAVRARAAAQLSAGSLPTADLEARPRPGRIQPSPSRPKPADAAPSAASASLGIASGP